jgi:hypothetical protein
MIVARLTCLIGIHIAFSLLATSWQTSAAAQPSALFSLFIPSHHGSHYFHVLEE